jgi:hypothetical protein
MGDPFSVAMSVFVVIWRILAYLSLGLGARRGFGTGLIEQGCELIAQALIRGSGLGFLCATGNARCEVQGFAGVGKTHLFQIFVLHAFEIAFGEVEDGFGQSELAFTKIPGAGGGIEEVLLPHDGFIMGGWFRAPGGVGFDAAAPIEIAGPALHGAEGGADFAADGGEAASGAEFQVGAEGFKGAVGFTFDLGKAGGGVGRVRGRTGGAGTECSHIFRYTLHFSGAGARDFLY